MASASTSMNDQPHGADDEQHAHPTEMQYVKIAIVLAIITLIEVAIYYIESVESILVPTLIALSTIKFVAVVGYFMHLKFDDRRLTVVFALGMAFALVIYIATVVVMRFHEITDFVDRMIA